MLQRRKDPMRRSRRPPSDREALPRGGSPRPLGRGAVTGSFPTSTGPRPERGPRKGLSTGSDAGHACERRERPRATRTDPTKPPFSQLVRSRGMRSEPQAGQGGRPIHRARSDFNRQPRSLLR
jgi:hypothetical protein